MKQYLFLSFLLISFAGVAQTKSMRDYTPRIPQLGDTTFTNRGTTGTTTFLQLKGLYFPGTTLQYMRGDGSLATFPTDNAGFSNGAGYLTGITSSQVTTALGFTPYNATNPSGYITSSALSPYELSSHAASTYQPIGSYLTTTTGDARYSLLAHTHTFASLTSKPTTIAGYGITDAFTQTAADGIYSPLNHTHTFASLTSKPTTLSGFGITDAYPLAGNPSGFLIPSDIAGKQNTITLTTTGSSGAATLTGGTLNIPQYSGGGGSVSAGDTTTLNVHTNSYNDVRYAAKANFTTLNVKRDYNAKGDAILLTDAVVTAGSTTVTSASAAFTSSDVGKVVCIPYAGTGATVGQSHMTTIASVTNGTTIVLAAAPALSIVGARTVTDAAITLNNTTLTSATANFTQGDIGKQISIPGAGLLIGNSNGSPEICYIATIVSSTQVTVTRKAQATVSAQTVIIPGGKLIYGTDDTSPLQSAITAGASAKKPVVLESGRYLTTASLVPVSNTKIMGYGAGASVIYPCGTGGFAVFQNIQTATPANAIVDVQFTDFEVDGIGNTASTYTTGNKGFYMRPMLRPVFKNLYVHNTGATGIGCDWLPDAIIVNNTLEHCGRQIKEFGSGSGGAGIGIGTGTWTEEPVLIQGNHVTDCGNYGIFVESQSSNVASRGIRIIGNDTRWNNIGIADHGTEGTLISGNTSEYNSADGINADVGFVAGLYAKNGLITGNLVRNNNTGININFIKDGSYMVSNNEVFGGSTGIQFQGTTGGTLYAIVIKGNLIHEGTGSGRGIYSPSGTWNMVEIDDNTIFNFNSSTSTRRPAIHMTITSCARLYVTGNKAWDTRGTGSKTQSYGLVLTGTYARFVYDRNDFQDNADGTADLTGATITVTATPSTNY